jgi:hypothetical protein
MISSATIDYFSPDQKKKRASYEKNVAPKRIQFSNKNCTACGSNSNKWQAVKKTNYIQSLTQTRSKSTKLSSMTNSHNEHLIVQEFLAQIEENKPSEIPPHEELCPI